MTRRPDRGPPSDPPVGVAIGVDVGGSGIKAAVVDVDAGRFLSERLRVPTPTPSTPDASAPRSAGSSRRLAKASGHRRRTIPVGVGLPGVAIDGVLMTAANIDPAWVDYPIAERLSKALEATGRDRQRRRRGGHRRDALRGRRGQGRAS